MKEKLVLIERATDTNSSQETPGENLKPTEKKQKLGNPEWISKRGTKPSRVIKQLLYTEQWTGIS